MKTILTVAICLFCLKASSQQIDSATFSKWQKRWSDTTYYKTTAITGNVWTGSAHFTTYKNTLPAMRVSHPDSLGRVTVTYDKKRFTRLNDSTFVIDTR